MEKKYNKDDWDDMSIEKLKFHLKNYQKLNNLFDKIIGFTSDEFFEISHKIKNGEDLLKQILKDKKEVKK